MEEDTFFSEGLLDDEETREKNSRGTSKGKSTRNSQENPQCLAKKAKKRQGTRKNDPEECESRVVLGSGCKYLRDNNLGLYCRMGTRKVRRANKGRIVCLDCDEPGKTPLEISDAEYKRLAARERNG